MPRAKVNLGISNLSVITLRRVHRKAKVLSFDTGEHIPDIVTWWLDKLPEQLTASQRIELMMIQLEMQASQTNQMRR